jgi:hypothetical protein
MDNNKENKNTLQILYDNLTYFDNYGSSVIGVIFITFILLLLISFSFAMIYKKTISDDWINQRCKLSVIPFAGFINKPDNMTTGEYTKQNFDYCIQTNVKSTAGFALEPLTFITNALSSVANSIISFINSIRAMFDKIRTLMGNTTKEIYGRIISFTIPIQKIIIGVKDMFAKMQGTLVSVLYTVLGSYYGLQSLMGVIAQALVKILIILASIILVLWITPFTWGTAAAATALFIAISIPLGLFLTFLTDVFHINLNLKIPKVPSPKKLKCFDENTFLQMNDGTEKNIIDICAGDILKNNDKVTANFKVISKGSIMYDLNGVIVSDTHLVKKDEHNWVRVSEHNMSRKVAYYDYDCKPYLYCLNTESKTIVINDITFSDWDEIYGTKTDDVLVKIRNYCLLNDIIKEVEIKDIHKYLENGFSQETNIKLKCGEIKKIHEIKIGDILEGGEKVYGVVKINGTDINQYCYSFGKYKFEGGPNLIVRDENMFITSTIDLEKNDKKNKYIKDNFLFHLLTNENTFIVNNIKFGDYNSSIDF